MEIKDCLKHADETKELILKKKALEEIPNLTETFFDRNSVYCIISDENTYKAAGIKVKKILEQSNKIVLGSHVFHGEPVLHADYDHVNFIKNWISALPEYKNIVPIAVGAGTINDLVKRASFELALPYFCIPTAASVDGYTPNGAALLINGFKQTVPCTAPKVVAADIDIIAKAPAYLTSSGFGDLASKIIAGTDWIIAEKAGSAGALVAPAVDQVCWAMCQKDLVPALNAAVDAVKGNTEAISILFQKLAITGFAMQYYKNSRPVSGAEHLFSHTWEMDDLTFDGVPVTHGHKVTIGTLAATAFTEIFFANPNSPPAVKNEYQRPTKAERESEVKESFKNSRGCEMVVKTALEKFMEKKTINAVNELFHDSYREIRTEVLEWLLPYKKLRELLDQAGCPLKGEAIGLNRTNVIATTRRAQMIRNKYSILDLAWDMGNFEEILSKIESSNFYLR